MAASSSSSSSSLSLRSFAPDLYRGIRNGDSVIFNSDCDGTLTVTVSAGGNESTIRLRPGVYENLRRIGAAGGIVNISSARSWAELLAVFNGIPNLHFVANDSYLWGEVDSGDPPSRYGHMPSYKECHKAASRFANQHKGVTASNMDAFYGIFGAQERSVIYEQAFTLLQDQVVKLTSKMDGKPFFVNKHPMGVTLEPETPGKQYGARKLFERWDSSFVSEAWKVYGGDGGNDKSVQAYIKGLNRGFAYKVTNNGNGGVPGYVNKTIEGTRRNAEFIAAIATELEHANARRGSGGRK